MGNGLQCERLFGEARAQKVSAYLEELSGAPCPCKRDQPCPLMAAKATPAPLVVVGDVHLAAS